MKKIAVILSGSGFKDGAEITETISTLISLGQVGAAYQCFAPDAFFPAVNHYNDEPAGERNALHEAARLARGALDPAAPRAGAGEHLAGGARPRRGAAGPVAD